METLIQDVRFAIRLLMKNPGFTAVAVTFALGIGALFSIVNGVLPRPLPYYEPQRLVSIYATDLQKGTANDPVSFADFEDWAKHSRTLDLSACGYRTFNLIGQQIPERIVGARTTGSFFEVLENRRRGTGIIQGQSAGVINYSVSQRTHEIGVRVALGAQRGDVLRLVVGEGLRLIAVGVGSGIFASFIAARFIGSMLFDVRPNDLGTFVGVSMVMTTVALLACYLPVRRALHVDPMVALRYE
jgi:hypothetical protein